MNKNIYNPIQLVVILLLCAACPCDTNYNVYNYIVLNNESKEAIVYLELDFGSFGNNDSLLPKDEVLWDRKKSTILPDSNLRHTFYVYDINSLNRGVKTMFYFFNQDSLESLPWQRIAQDNIILKRVDISSVAQLDSMNWTISYP